MNDFVTIKWFLRLMYLIYVEKENITGQNYNC